MKLIIRNSNGEITEQEITENMQFNPTAGEQYFFTGVENYTFNLTGNNSTLDIHFLDNNGDKINVVLHDMAELIQQNNPMDSFSVESTFGVSTNQAGDQAIEEALNNKELESGEIVEALKDALSMDGSTLAGGAVIDDFQGLLNALDATATGEVQNTAYNPLFDAMQTQDVSQVEPASPSRPDSYGDNDNSIERAEGSYGSEKEETVIPDTTATPAPVVTITEDTNNDGTLVNSEISGDTNFRVDIPVEAEVGDTLNLTINGVTTEITIDQDMIDNGYSSSVTEVQEGESLNVSATITDKAGNESESSSDSVIRADETATPAPTVTITEDTNNDGSLVNSEVNGVTNFTVGIPSEAVIGDTLNLTVDGVTTQITIDQDMIDNGYNSSVTELAEGESLNVSATITDQAGNTSDSASDSVTRADETATPAPTVTITEDTNNDGSLATSEVSGDTNFTVGIPIEAEVGDTLNLTVDGVTTQITIDQDMIDNGYNSSVTELAEGESLNVSATITDQAGNTSGSASDSVTRAIELSSTDESHTIDFNEERATDGDSLITSPDAANVVIVLDTSGSMTNANYGGVVTLDDGSTTTRLQLAKESLEEMINTYKDFGGVNVRLTTFSSEGNAGTEWMSANEAIETINALSSGGYTNYEDALFETYDNFTEAPNGEKSSVYFISDGTPTKENKYDADVDSDSTQGISGSAVDDDYIEGWTEFLTENAKELNVIGIGTGLQEDDPDFQRVAVEIGTVKTNVMVVEDETELQETLVNSVTKEIEGNLLDNLSNEEGDVTLDSVTIDNVTYTDVDMPITTPEGAVLNVDFTTGDFSYTAKAADFTGDTLESFSVNASDESGDTTSFDVNMSINLDDDSSTIMTADGELAFLDDTDAVDFSVVAENAEDIHKVNLEAEPSQTLSLSVEDVVTSNDDHEMVIVGNNGDVIELEGEGWSRETGVAVDGEEGTFDHYTSTSTDGTVVDVYVESEITVQTDDLF